MRANIHKNSLLVLDLNFEEIDFQIVLIILHKNLQAVAKSIFIQNVLHWELNLQGNIGFSKILLSIEDITSFTGITANWVQYS